jgi:O-acetyl-ADP-ribose deacetylase (regulator of RNase III)
MICRVTGNLFDARVDALVNTVNCVGVMGKGAALAFKQAFPANFKAYKRACEAGEVRAGRMFVFDLGGLVRPRWIVNFPTKRHWRERSRMEDIEAGLEALAGDIGRLGIRSIALPALGCGHGGLDWREVYPLIERRLGVLDGAEVLVYESAVSASAEGHDGR